jgi:hypothetical protein
MMFSGASLRWLECLLLERFGYGFLLEQGTGCLKMSFPNSRKVMIFDVLQTAFHQSSSNFPCCSWDASVEGFSPPVVDNLPAPSVNELPVPLIELNENGANIHYDILGLTYWMLTRLEEVGRSDLDEHGRFPATSSHAYKHGYLERPIVDEWLHILGQVIQKVWPQIKLKEHEFSIKVSHDVDSPSLYAFKPWRHVLRAMAGHILKRRDVKAFCLAPYIKITSRKQLSKYDPHNTFEWLMDMSDKYNLKSAFYFICGHTSDIDGDYQLNHPIIRKLMKRISERGHEIGLHPSYGTYQASELIQSEANRLRHVMHEENITQEELGGRMHFLRWENPTTLQAWSDANMVYDTTLGYADRPGFRCGTCFEYPAYNPVAQQMLRIRIRPLIVMECTVIAKRYLGLGYSPEAENKFISLKNTCRQVGGCFTLLWHNSQFCNQADYEIYGQVVRP